MAYGGDRLLGTGGRAPWQGGLAGATQLGVRMGVNRIIAGVDHRVDAAHAKLPGLAGKSFVLAQYIVGDSLVAVADPADGSSVFFRELGMTQLPSLVAEGEKLGRPRVQVSTERLDLLRFDALLDYPTATALNTPTPLSIRPRWTGSCPR